MPTPPGRRSATVEHGERVAARVERARRRRRTSDLAREPGRAARPAARSAAADGLRRARRRARRWSRGTRPARRLAPKAAATVVGRLGRARPRPCRSRPRASRLRGERGPGGCARRAGRAWRGTPSGARRWRPARRRSGRAGLERAPRAGTRAGPPSGRRPARAPRCDRLLGRSGNSLTPVIGVRRVATSVSAAPPGRPRRASATSPESSAATAPPAASISWKNAQRGAGEVVGERLDVPGAARRVDHPRQVRLLDQQRLGVAGDPPGERRRQRPSAASNGSTVTASAPPTPAAKPATVARSRFTHGSRRVHHRRRGDGVLALAPCRVGRAAGLEHPRPQPARGAQLGDRRELVGGGGVAELQQPGGGRRRRARRR